MHDQEPAQAAAPQSRPGGVAARVFEIAIGAVAALDLIVLTLVTVVDVVGRYLFNSPLKGADELTVFALATAVFAGLPLAIARGGLISVEVLVLRFPLPVRRRVKLATDVVAAVFLAFCGWQLILKAGKLAAYGDATMFLRIPTAPFAYGMAAACFFSAAVFVVLAFVALSGGQDSPEVESGA